jgi:hypothetical protein
MDLGSARRTPSSSTRTTGDVLDHTRDRKDWIEAHEVLWIETLTIERNTSLSFTIQRGIYMACTGNESVEFES